MKYVIMFTSTPELDAAISNDKSWQIQLLHGNSVDNRTAARTETGE